jgi:hypothetical protein
VLAPEQVVAVFHLAFSSKSSAANSDGISKASNRSATVNAQELKREAVKLSDQINYRTPFAPETPTAKPNADMGAFIL